MKLLTTQQIKDWDSYTINSEPIKSIDLMERAATAFVEKLNQVLPFGENLRGAKIFCGLGNNGGDGLAIARLLAEQNIHVEVFIIEYSKNKSADFKLNEKKLINQKKVLITSITDKSKLPIITKNCIVIDALFGTGLNKPLDGLALKVVQHINVHSTCTIAVDIPSGLKSEIFTVDELDENKIIHAHHTLTFQLPKQSFLHAETFPFVGDFHVLDIGLKKEFLDKLESDIFYTTQNDLPKIKPRNKFSHKGNFGHAICIGGSYGKIGANILMSKACLRTGAGLVTSFIPKVGYTILQTSLPESMVITDDELFEIRNFPDTNDFDAIGIGPGMGTNEYTLKSFYKWLPTISKPCVIDADALNICAKLLQEHHDSFHFPINAVITPHPKEFDRLAGISKNSFERLQRQIHFAKYHQIIVVLKGAHTSIAIPDGKIHFNSTGNAAMATGGSGDVLTGVITSLLTQGYDAIDAAILGVFLHGLTGDIAAKNKATVIASDMIEKLPEAIFSIN
jgi:ADP-dependent NAD(P)H-hydrate dehydratase / NAD(P)H-hydrate epimerase